MCSSAEQDQPRVGATVALPAAAVTSGAVAPAMGPATGVALAPAAGLPDATPLIGTSTGGGGAATVDEPTGNTALTIRSR